MVDARVCPLGEAVGGSLLAIAEDGRVLLEFVGSVIQLGKDWQAALDNLILSRGRRLLLAENYERLDPPRS